MRLRLPWERICAQYGFRFFIQEKSKFVSSTASDRKGLVKGESVPLDRVLPTFARTKVGPRRVGVLIKSIIRLAPPEVITDFLTSAPVRRTKTPPTIPAGGAVFAYVISSSRTARALHRWCAGYGAPGGCPARPNTPRTAPSPRGSRGSCAGSWSHLRYTGPPRARNADR